MSENLSVYAEVAVPALFPINYWQRRPGRDGDPVVLDSFGAAAPGPIGALTATAAALGFVWLWDEDRRLLHGSTPVTVGFGPQLGLLGEQLQAARWGYRFVSYNAAGLGETWEWMPDWPTPRHFIQAGPRKALTADAIRAVVDEAAAVGVDLAQHLHEWLGTWPGETWADDQALGRPVARTLAAHVDDRAAHIPNDDQPVNTDSKEPTVTDTGQAHLAATRTGGRGQHMPVLPDAFGHDSIWVSEACNPDGDLWLWIKDPLQHGRDAVLLRAEQARQLKEQLEYLLANRHQGDTDPAEVLAGPTDTDAAGSQHTEGTVVKIDVADDDDWRITVRAPRPDDHRLRCTATRVCVAALDPQATPDA